MHIFVDIVAILQKRPQLNHLLEFLSHHSNKWHEIAIALNVLAHVRHEQAEKNIGVSFKLSNILDSWTDTLSSPVTWEYIIDKVLGAPYVNLPDVAREVKEKLSQPKYYSNYIRQPDFVDTRNPQQ